MSPAAAVDNAHFLRESFWVQVWPLPLNPLVVQGKVGQPLLAIPPRQLAYLRSANAAVSIVDHHVRSRPFIRGGEIVGHEWNRRELKLIQSVAG